MRSLIFQKKIKGFTLIEILISITILSVGIIPLFRIFAVGKQAHKFSMYEIIATTIAENNIEKLKATPFFDMLYQKAKLQAPLQNTLPGEYKVEVISSDVVLKDPFGAKLLIKIVLKVSWRSRPDPSNKAPYDRSIEVPALIANQHYETIH